MTEQRRRTKIIATVGPASDSVDMLVKLIEAGVDVFRLNFSHADREQHTATVANAREASKKTGKEVGLLGDLPGPKLRVGEIAGDLIELEAGRGVSLTTEEVVGDEQRIHVSWPGMTKALKAGDIVYLADGSIRLRVVETKKDAVSCMVEVGGPLTSHKGVNVPHADTGLPAVSESDLGWVDFAVEQGVDILAISFVRRREDLHPVSERLEELGSDIPLIAKIEKPEAAENAEGIVREATGIMVARGDLGIEVPIASLPVLQKRLVAIAGLQAKPAIIATQMLASMVRSPRPTRAEVADVANAVFDGTDAVMLSEETAVGEHAVEAVKTMDRIARETEGELPYGDWLLTRVNPEHPEIASSVTQGAVGAVYRLGLAALVVPTSGGRTARFVSAHRPRVPVLAVTSRIEIVRRLNLLFGVQSVLTEEHGSLTDLLDDCGQLAGREGVARSGDLIAITAGLPEQQLGTNLFVVNRVP